MAENSDPLRNGAKDLPVGTPVGIIAMAAALLLLGVIILMLLSREMIERRL